MLVAYMNFVFFSKPRDKPQFYCMFIDYRPVIKLQNLFVSLLGRLSAPFSSSVFHMELSVAKLRKEVLMDHPLGGAGRALKRS